MINSIIEAVGAALNGEFGDNYTIYAEPVRQGLKEPCFFILCISSSDQLFFGKKYLLKNQFCIQYFPANKDNVRAECIEVCGRLYSCLEYITAGGDLTMGTKMHAEISDGILNFFVNYDMFVYKKTEADAMEELHEKIDAKGDK